MKKTIALAVAGILALSLAVFSPPSLDAQEMDRCFKNHEECRRNVMEMDAPWQVVALFLTVCDAALIACIFQV